MNLVSDKLSKFNILEGFYYSLGSMSEFTLDKYAQDYKTSNYRINTIITSDQIILVFNIEQALTDYNCVYFVVKDMFNMEKEYPILFGLISEISLGWNVIYIDKPIATIVPIFEDKDIKHVFNEGHIYGNIFTLSSTDPYSKHSFHLKLTHDNNQYY